MNKVEPDDSQPGKAPKNELLEIQRMDRMFVLPILFLAAAPVWGIAITQLALGIPVGPNPAPDIVIQMLAFVFGLVFPLAFWYAKLQIRVNETGIYYIYLPFEWKEKFIPFSELANARIVFFKPILEYGGLGIRLRKNAVAYLAKGGKGVSLVLENGKTVVLGSQKAGSLFAAIEIQRQNQRRKARKPLPEVDTIVKTEGADFHVHR